MWFTWPSTLHIAMYNVQLLEGVKFCSSWLSLITYYYHTKTDKKTKRQKGKKTKRPLLLQVLYVLLVVPVLLILRVPVVLLWIVLPSVACASSSTSASSVRGQGGCWCPRLCSDCRGLEPASSGQRANHPSSSTSFCIAHHPVRPLIHISISF